MFQTKEQDKTPEEQLSDMELDNLPKKEFRVMTVKMIQELGKRMDAQNEKLQEVHSKELENVKKTQSWRIQELKWKTHWKESIAE